MLFKAKNCKDFVKCIALVLWMV